MGTYLLNSRLQVRVLPGALEIAGQRLSAAAPAGELGIGLDLVVGKDGGAGQGNEGHLLGLHRRTGNDPSRLAGADQPDLARVDIGAGSHGVDRADGVSGQEIEVAVVPRTAFSLGLSCAAFVVGEEPHPARVNTPTRSP